MVDLHFKLSEYASGVTAASAFVQTRHGMVKVIWEITKNHLQIRSHVKERVKVSNQIFLNDPNLKIYISEHGPSKIALLISYGRANERVYLHFNVWLNFWRLWEFLRCNSVVNQDVKRFYSIKTKMTENVNRTKVYHGTSIKMQHPVLLHSVSKVGNGPEDRNIVQTWRALSEAGLVCQIYEIYESTKSFVLITESLRVMTLKKFLETSPVLGVVEVVEMVEALMFTINNFVKLFPNHHRVLTLDQMLVTTNEEFEVTAFLSFDQLYSSCSPAVFAGRSFQWLREGLSVLMCRMLTGEKIDYKDTRKRLKKIFVEIQGGALDIDKVTASQLMNQFKFLLDKSPIEKASGKATLEGLCSEMFDLVSPPPLS
mmetsp:Transcript_36792/g.41860  ORF Transcript_36792/g.41860 Transcript_36792/m.41860 type:complete len:370 (-) Transcript_36792:74-1183(-)